MKRIVSIILAAVILLSVCVLFTSCSGNLAGTWIPDSKTNSKYPENYLTLNSDGSGSVDGYSCDWTAENGTLTLNVSYKSFVYSYSVSGNTLTLDSYTYTRQ